MTLEEALRAASAVSRINIFRNRARGGWEAAVARDQNTSQFAVGQGDTAAEALLRALQADAAGRKPRAERAAGDARATAAPAQPGSAQRTEPGFSGGIFG